MSRRRLLSLGVAALVVIAVAAALRGSGATTQPQAVAPSPVAVASSGESDGGSDADQTKGGTLEAEEESQGTDERIKAFAEANAGGTWWKTGQLRRDVAPGWSGERRIDARADDWEPAIAADPNGPYVYLLVTRYTGKPACPRGCPTPAIVLYRSTDDGTSWHHPQFLCPCKGVAHQYDPVIQVVAGTGAVYAVWMNEFHVVFSRSTDHGRTWSKPVATYGDVPWNDKPFFATSADGQDVYVSWNGPSHGDPFVAQSHDGGRMWTHQRLLRTHLYYYDFGATVLPDGTVVFAESGVKYVHSGSEIPAGEIRDDAFISRDGGNMWERHLIANVEAGTACTSKGCRADFYTGHVAVGADAAGDLVYAYDGADHLHGKQSIRLRTSTDEGLTWSDPTLLSTTGENATMPAAVGTGAGDLRVWYMQTNGRPHAWNVWYRASTDDGVTWSAPVLLSDVTAGVGYVGLRGFREDYGDYGMLAVTDTGASVAAWGEGFSYAGPGQVWVNRQT